MNCSLWFINCRAIEAASVSLSDSFKEVINYLIIVNYLQMVNETMKETID